MLLEKLEDYASNRIYPMHMPGHKRNASMLTAGLPYEIDISEIHGFDNLHEPKGILKEIADLAAELYGSDRAFLLVNGSTVGIMAAIGAHVGNGEKILVARNCHLAVHNAIALFGLTPTYIMPETDSDTAIALSVTPASVKLALEENSDIKLIVITSPTYEGILSDVGAIAAIAHERGIPLLVDAAHGAHLGFSSGFPGSAVKEGADIIVMSLHKTLPALTQCALMHICGNLANASEASRLLSVFQTSSPSYVLMASIDRCLRLLATDGARLFGDYERNLHAFYEDIRSLRKLSFLQRSEEGGLFDARVLGDAAFATFDIDPGKIVINTSKTALSGTMLKDTMRLDHNIELEMACQSHCVAMTSICDTDEGFSRLSKALNAIDSTLAATQKNALPHSGASQRRASVVRNKLPFLAEIPATALKKRGEFISIDKAVGLMSLEYVWAYPPGIPIIAPGEIIDQSTVSLISELAISGIEAKSTKARLPHSIYAVGPLAAIDV